MELRNILTFLKVCKLKSFSLAANELGYSQSAVSTQISNLEKSLNTTLFDRIGHKIYLTPSGKIFLRYAQNINLLTDELYNELANNNDVRGTIRIAMPESVCSCVFSNILISYQKLYPHVNIIIKTGLTKDMFTWLLNNEVDLIYTLDVKIQSSSFVILKEAPVKINFYTSSSHVLNNKENITVNDLRQFPIYMTEENVSYRKELDRILAEQSEYLLPSFESGNVDVIVRLIKSSNGIGFIPEFSINNSNIYDEQDKITELHVNNINVSVWKQLLSHKGKSLTPAMKALVDML